MVVDLVCIVIGLTFLTLGGNSVVKHSLDIAVRLKVSPLLAGLVIVGFGTSSPEFMVSVQAALKGQADISIGNVLGSNTANILLILGVGAIIAIMPTTRLSIVRDGTSMILASILFIVLAWDGELRVADGIIFLISFVAFLLWAYFTERVPEGAPASDIGSASHTSEPLATTPAFKTILMLLIGFAMLIGGAKLFLRGAVALAESWGVPEVIIGLTLVAVGTSLPELAATTIAAIKGETDVAVGNILGSNIFNILFILGVSSLLAPLPMAPRLIQVDQWVMLGTALLLVAFMAFGGAIGRVKGVIMVLAYAAYVTTMFYVGS